jgi:hypothetical protein
VLAGGVLAAAFLAVAVVCGYLSFAQVLLDQGGTSAAGRVVEVRASSVWQRYRMNVPVFTLRYSFEAAAGATVTGEDSVTESTWRGLEPGGAVNVDYLAALPALNRVERPPRDLLFFGFAAFALVALWLAVMSLYRAFVPPPR